MNELSYVVQGSVRRIPDVVILREGFFKSNGDRMEIRPGGIVGLIETKKLDIAKGMAQVSQYQSQIRKTLGPARVVGSTTFDQVWIHDERSGNYLLESVKDVVQLTSQIEAALTQGLGVSKQKYTDAQYTEYLHAAVDELTPFTGQIRADILDYLTGIFLAKVLHAEIAKDKQAMQELKDTADKAAAFILVNQLFLYHLLTSQADSVFKPVDTPVSLKDLQEAFDRVLAKDFAAIFSAKILPYLKPDATDTVNGVVEELKFLGIEKRSNDIIGKVFHSLIPPKLRKRIAAYYTANSAARLLSVVCIRTPDALMADLACGSGTMLVEAYKRKKELTQDTLSPCDLHNKLLSEIYGFDIAMFSGQLAAINLFIQDLACFPEQINIAIDDAFHIAPGSQTLLTLGEQVRTDFVQTSGKMKIPKFFNAILINPPFTDRRRMTPEYVKSIDSKMRSAFRLQYVTGQFHLGLYFILHAESFLQEGGFLGVVIPESILQNVTTNRIKDFLLRRFTVFAYRLFPRPSCILRRHRLEGNPPYSTKETE